MAIKEIVSYYTIDPDRISGSLDTGPYLPHYAGMEEGYSEEQVNRFELAFRGVGLQVFYQLHTKLKSRIEDLIKDGYTDVHLHVVKYDPGACAIQFNPMGGESPLSIVVEPM